MSYKRKFSIFVSSTYEDLKIERQEVYMVALENDFIPVGMEQFHAWPASQWDVITKMIDECDYYLLIIGGRYGSIDKDAGISYTEREYEYAKAKKMPVVVLYREQKYITQDKTDDGDDKHEKQKKLDEFRRKVKDEGNTVDSFGEITDLKYKVATALKNAIVYQSEDAGWVRYSDLKEIIKEKVVETLRAYQERETSQINVINKMQDMLHTFGEQLNDIQDKQENLQVPTAITDEEINKLFDVTDSRPSNSITKISLQE